MCGENVEGMRSWACYDGTCAVYKGKVFVEGCPHQHSDSRRTVWNKAVMKKAGPVGLWREATSSMC